MLTPDTLPDFMRGRTRVTHHYPHDWDEAEKDQHRYDDCPCSPTMNQVLCPCPTDHAYHWIVNHTRIHKTEST